MSASSLRGHVSSSSRVTPPQTRAATRASIAETVPACPTPRSTRPQATATTGTPPRTSPPATPRRRSRARGNEPAAAPSVPPPEPGPPHWRPATADTLDDSGVTTAAPNADAEPGDSPVPAAAIEGGRAWGAGQAGRPRSHTAARPDVLQGNRARASLLWSWAKRCTVMVRQRYRDSSKGAP